MKQVIIINNFAEFSAAITRHERDAVTEPSLAAALSPPKWTPPTGAPAQVVGQ